MFLLWHCCAMLGGIRSSRQFSAMLFKNKSNRKANKGFPQNENVGLLSTWFIEDPKKRKKKLPEKEITVQQKAVGFSQGYFTCILNSFTCAGVEHLP